jgi:hypothetical protein
VIGESRAITFITVLNSQTLSESIALIFIFTENEMI